MTRGLGLLILLGAVAPVMGALETTQHTGPVESVLTLEPEHPVIGDDLILNLCVTAE